MKNSLYDRMLNENVKKLLLKLSLPTVLSMLITAVYSIADTFFVSQIDKGATSAITVVFSLQSLIQAVGFTLGMGAGALISRLRGKGETDEANVIGSSTFLFGVIIGVILMVFGLFFTEGTMRLLGSTDSALPYAVDYGKYIVIAIPFMIASFVMNNILRSEGHSNLSMIGLGIGGIINIGLDPLFIYAFNMGCGGAGCATMISQLVSFSILLSMFIFKVSLTRISPKLISKNPMTYLNVIRLGAPTLFRQGCATVASITLNYLGKPFGDECIAALGITNKIYLFVRNIVIGIGQGYQPILGYNYGAKKNDRIKEAFKFALLLMTIVCLTAMTIVLVIPGPLAKAFSKDVEVQRIATIAIRFLAISFPFLGYSTIVNQCLQITGQSVSATFLASLRQGILYVPIIFLFTSLWNEVGLCLTQPISDLLTAIISIPFMFFFFNRVLKKNV